MDSLVTIICLLSGNGLLVQAGTAIGHVQVTQAEGDVHSGIRRDWRRDSESPGARLRAFFFSTSSRRLLQDLGSDSPPISSASSPRKLSTGGIVGLSIGIPVILLVILATLVMWYLRRRRSATAKSRQPAYTLEADSTSNSNITCPPTVDFKGFRSWMKSIWARSGAKPKDDPSTPTVGSKPGFQSWIKSFWTAATPKPKVYLSSACEMEFLKLQAATDNFSEANLLGEGGSARVYRAKLDGGDYGAVKLITDGGRHALAEFQAEIDLMRQVRHPNLVSLLGYCSQGDRRLLVYELMRNGSLDDQLYGPKKGSSLSWHRRIKIALDSARGLAYLHEHCIPPVVHRDFKASNILLDENLNAKISDFGLATPLAGLTPEESLQLVGTIGYVAPEFFSSGILTEKSDVYAFGVTLLELLTGRKPIDHSLPVEQQSLVNWATPQLTNRKMLPKLVASQVQQDLNLKHLYQVAAVAALCVQREASYRPLIGDIVQSLLPLVPVELGGAMRSDSTKSSADSSLSNSHRLQHQPGSESFSFARETYDLDLQPPEISSAEMP